MFAALSLIVFVVALARFIKRGADKMFWFVVFVGVCLVIVAIALKSSFDLPKAGVLAELIVALLRVFVR